MSWFDSSFGFAKTALSQAQKSIDRVLDIDESDKTQQRSEDQDGEEVKSSSSFNSERESSTPDTVQASKSLTDSFVSTWGNTDSYWGNSGNSKPVKKQNEATPTRKSKLKNNSAKKPTNTSNQVSKQTTPPKNTTPTATPHSVSPNPASFNPVTLHSTSNVTSTPIQHDIEHRVESVDGETVNNDSYTSSDNVTVNQRGDEPGAMGDQGKGTEPDNVSEELQDKKKEEELVEGREDGEKDKEEEQRERIKVMEDERKRELEEKEQERLKQEENEKRKQKEEEKQTQDETIAGSSVHEEEVVTDTPPAPLDHHHQSDTGNSVDTVVGGDGGVVSISSGSRGPVGDCESNNTTQIKTNQLRSGENVVKLETELAQVKDLLQIRESKVLEQSEELIKLQQTNQEMQKCLDEFKKQIEKMDDSKDSLMRRINGAEEKIQTVTRERNSLKKQLQAINNEQRGQAEKRLTEILKEKDEMIAGLMEEGEKLSKQELQSNNTIKKLRSKEKTNESTITTLKQQIEEFENEIKTLKDVIKKKEENELKYQESLAQMNIMIEQQAKELNQIKPERNELQEKARSLQTNLDNAYKELTELRKTNALSQSAMQEATVSAQQVAKDELKKELEEQRLKGEKEKDALLLQISELRMGVSRAEQQATWREDQLRQEISDLHKRIQESEGRNQDLSDTISDATRPLLRQIEHLRSAQTAQSNNWERLESSLTQRLVEAQTQLNTSSEKERNAMEKLLTLQSRVSGLEEQLGSVRQERSQLRASLETERTKLSTLEDTHNRELSRHETYRLNVQQNVEELKREKETLERQLEYERVRLEAESRKADLELQEKEKLRNQLAMSLTTMPPSLALSRQSSTSTPNDNMDTTLSSGSASDLNSLLVRGPVGGSLGSASVLEHLQSVVKQKEGELTNSQEMVSSLERSRSAITEELAKVSASNEALKKEVQTIPEIKQQLLEVTKKYEALLQMFGEKVEEAEELRLDIQDLKSLYRQQIEELLMKK